MNILANYLDADTVLWEKPFVLISFRKPFTLFVRHSYMSTNVPRYLISG